MQLIIWQKLIFIINKYKIVYLLIYTNQIEKWIYNYKEKYIESKENKNKIKLKFVFQKSKKIKLDNNRFYT